MESSKSIRTVIIVSVLIFLAIGAAGIFYLYFNPRGVILHVNFSDKEELQDFVRTNNGSIQGEPKVIKEFMGYALELDGKSYVDCGSNEKINDVKDAITIEAWIKPKNLVSGKSDTIILLKGAYILGLTRDERADTSNLVYGYINGVAKFVKASVHPETWNHVTLVYDRSLPNNNIKIYVNGIVSEQKDYKESILSGTENIFIGGNGKSNFSGLVGGVKIYNKALTEEKVKNIFKQKS